MIGIFLSLTFHIVGLLSSGQTVHHRVELQDGKSTITITASKSLTDHTNLTCEWYDPYGKLVSTQTNTTACVATTNLVLPSHLAVNITNTDNEEVVYDVLVESK
jgi:hypothetical protein